MTIRSICSPPEYVRRAVSRSPGPWARGRSRSPVPVNAWTHLAATYDGSNLRLYTNGNLVRTTANSGSLITTAGLLSIGGNAVWGEYFSGLIDELEFFPRVLTSTEIQAIVNASINGKCKTVATPAGPNVRSTNSKLAGC